MTAQPAPAAESSAATGGAWAAERTERLRLFLVIDSVVAVGAALFLTVIQLTVSTTAWVAFLAGSVWLVALLLSSTVALLSRGRVQAAFVLFAVTNWAIAVVAATAAPFAMPVLVIISLLPAALAAPVVSRAQLPRVVFVTILVATAVVALGTLQDAVGIEDDLPTWVPKLVIVFFTPVMAGLIAVIVYQTIETLTDALDAAVASRNDLRQAQVRLVTTSDETRRRIERDLHDGAQQRLTALAIGLGRIQARAEREHLPIEAEVTAMRNHLADARSELRRLAHGLYPSALATDGLGAALRGEADRFDLAIDVRCDPLPATPLAIQAAVYFCCLEALQNAVRHGSPSLVTIAIGARADHVVFEVADDGVGFVRSEAVEGHGFANMADRVGAFGGSVDVESAPGAGTVVRGAIPLSSPT